MDVVDDAAALLESVVRPPRFGVVYERHLRAVHGYLRRRVGDGAAEDLCAEVFARAFRARAAYDPRHPTALPWLLGIATHVIGDHRRAERRRLATLERLVARGEDVALEPAHRALAPEVVRALRRLRAADRDALLLVVWGELSYDEAALALGVPIGTVRSRIARARRRLAGDLEGPQTTTAALAATGDEHA